MAGDLCTGHPVGAAGLLGTWAVADAADTLTLEPHDLRLAVGGKLGSWRAADGAFVADVYGCAQPPPGQEPDMSTPDWLDSAVRVERDGQDVLLRDGGGAVTARLVREGPGAADPAADAGPAPLPAHLTPPTPEELLGTWAAEGSRSARPPSVTFSADRRYLAFDGANQAAGRWVRGDDGLLLATGGPMTLMATAQMVPVPTWVAATTRAGLDGAILVLLDGAGRELGRLTRAPS